MASLELSLEQLRAVRDGLCEAIRSGLGATNQPVAALPAYLPPPAFELRGEALVIDTGGTNMRAARVRLRPDAPPQIVAGPVQERLPVREHSEGNLNADDFFGLQARLAQPLNVPPGLPVGYCFSYPCEVYESRDARLTHWTKGIQIEGVEGTLVGQGLQRALQVQGLEPGPVRVLNDTVASLLASATLFEGPATDVIGLIVGTGTNMAGFYEGSQVSKITTTLPSMAINYESGNYAPPHLCTADDTLDAQGPTPGQQRFEKAVSGHYLPFIFQQLHPEIAGFDPHEGSGALAAILRNEPHSAAAKTVSLLFARSADLVAAGLAGAIATYTHRPPHVGIVAEGGLFWRGPNYAQRVQSTLQTLLPSGQRFTLLRTDEANLVGAACAALTP